MSRVKKYYDVYVAKVDNRHPNIKREFPNVQYIGAGTKYTDLNAVRQHAQRQPAVTRRKYPPTIRIFVIK